MVDVEALARMLAAAARARRTLTYGEILRHFGRRPGSRNASALMKDLGAACDLLARQGSPEAACIVVRKADQLPGDGYFAAMTQNGADDATLDRKRFVKERQEALFAFWEQADDLPSEIVDFLRTVPEGAERDVH